MARPIRRLVQLVLDRRAADKTEADAKQTLGRVDGALKGLKRTALAVGGAIVAAMSIRAITRFGAEAVRVAAEAEKSWTRLAGVLDNTGTLFKSVEGEIRMAAAAMQDATTVGDEEFADILAGLVSITGDYGISLQNVVTVANTSVLTNRSLEESTRLVGRALMGNTESLRELGIEGDTAAEAVANLQRKGQGLAEAMGNTLAGKLGQINDLWGDFKQGIGDADLAADSGTSTLEMLRQALQRMVGWVNANQEALSGFGRAIAALIQPTLEFGRVSLGWLARGAAAAADGLALARLAAAKFNDVIGRDGRAAEMRAEAQAIHEWAQAVYEASDAMLAAKLSDFSGTGAGGSIATPTFGQLAPGARIDGAGAGGGAGGSGAAGTGGIQAGEIQLSRVTQLQNEFDKAMAASATMAEALGTDYDFVGAKVSHLTSLLQQFAEMGMSAQDPVFQHYLGQLDGIRQKMAAIQREGEVTGAIMENLGPLIAGALGGNIGAIAKAKATQNALMSAELAVQALVAATNPFTAARAGPLAAAAAKHAAIAAAWGGLAATAGGGGSAGASVSLGTGGGSAGIQSEASGPQGPEVHIYFEGPGFSAVNPEVQRVVQGAVRNAEERYGSNSRVRVHR